MKPYTVQEKSIPETVTTIPMQYPSVIPIPNDSSNVTKWRVIAVASVIISVLVIGAVVLTTQHTRNNDENVNVMSELESWMFEAERQHRKNFEVQVNYNGESCIESVHSDERENIVTYHYTGENGREIDVVVYDYNQGLVAFKSSNNTECLFASTTAFPNINLDELQLASRNKEVIDASIEVRMYVSGEIPSGFLQRSIGPVFADLCNGLPSFWLENVVQVTGAEDDESRRKKRDDSEPIVIEVGGLTITLPGGGKFTLITYEL